jgi:hypothetical protein
MAGIRSPILTLVLLVALPQVQAAFWNHWACEGSETSTDLDPRDMDDEGESFDYGDEVCCMWTGNDGTLTTDARRCGSRALH